MWIYIICALVIGVFGWILYKHLKNVDRTNQEIEAEAQLANHLYNELAQKGYVERKIQHELQKQKAIVKMIPADADVEAVVDAIIANRKEKMKLLNIEYTESINDLQYLKMSRNQLLSLFLNLFDNAIEACAEIERNRKICLETSKTPEGFCIEIGNSKSSVVKPIEHDFITTKEDASNHGFGMGIIREIVDEYNGKIEYEDKGDFFKVRITLPME